MMDYEALCEQRETADAFSAHNGIHVTSVSEGAAEAAMEVTDASLNPYAAVHGGALFTLCDITGGAAAASHGISAVTLDSDVHFLRPALNCTRLVARATELKRGRRALVYRVQVFNQDETLLVDGTFTYMTVNVPVGGKDASEGRA